MKARNVNYFKAGFTAAICIYGIVIARDVDEFRFLDNVDLIPHEAGHMLFSWFGEFLMVLGGTLGQLFVPIALGVYFYLRKEKFSAAVTLFWLGQNFINVSRYVKDAQAMELPLVSLGGGDSIHDWNYILLRLNLLKHDQGIGNTVLGLAFVIMLLSGVLGFMYSFDREEY